MSLPPLVRPCAALVRPLHRPSPAAGRSTTAVQDAARRAVRRAGPLPCDLRGVPSADRTVDLRAAPGSIAGALEDSPSGLWRSLGKRVGGNPSGVRISHPPQSRRPSSARTIAEPLSLRRPPRNHGRAVPPLLT